MELLDRYLQAVKKHLPWQRQDDIIAELKANLESQLEDKEAELGRPLTQGEAEDWLKQLGPPIQVAARYQPQRYLIGPAVFPIYWYVLRLALTWASIIYSIVVVAQVFGGQVPSGDSLLEAILRVPGVLLTTTVWVTLVFAVLEFVATHFPEKFKGFPVPSTEWSPASLPPVEKAAANGKKPRSYAQAVAEVIFGFLFLAWLLLIPQHPYLIMGPGAAYLRVSPFQLAPVWAQVFLCLVAVNIVQMGWNVESLLRGRWQRPQPVKNIVIKAIGLIPLAVLLAARDHASVLLKNPLLDQARFGEALSNINNAINGVAVLICAIVAIQLVWDIVQMILSFYRRRAAAIR
jgi:hypothetical protein